MSPPAANRRILMVRPDLEQIPEFAPPAGFSLRWYQPGDERHWFRIHLAADWESDITPELFGQRFGADAAVLAQRQCYLLEAQGNAVGTATAWFDDNFEAARYGRVHYVAVVPERQGRGLGRSLMTVVCRRLRELGHERAYLATSSVRIRAIRLYLGFGFQPLIRDPEERDLWCRLIEAAQARGVPNESG